MRIVVMGDSFTYGQGVYPYDKRFPEQAEAIFRKQNPGLDVEFINVGICGCNLPCYNKKVLNLAMRLNPDFILYQWFVNDMDIKRDASKFKVPPFVSNKKMHRFLIEHSVLYFLVQRGWGSARVMLGHQMDYPDYLKRELGDPKSKYAVAASSQLKNLLDKLSGRNIPHGIVLFPDAGSKQSEYKLGFLHEQVLNLCRERQIGCLDLRDAYKKFDGDVKVLWANIFDPHPSAVAHREAAEKIIDFFGETWKEMAAQKITSIERKDEKE
ncbi:hypothetical protein VU06_01910 [Desulfobulbus sp. F3]|nr:hypothetical protein [Desulfobulbus sp. F3]